GMYLPFWTFDTEAEAWYRGRGGVYVEEENDEGETTTHTEWTSVSGYVSNEYDDIQICAAGEHAQEVVDKILPYSTEENAKVFASGYLSGFGAEHYTFGADQGFEQAQEQIRRDLEERAESDIRRKGYDTADVDKLEVEYQNTEYKHLLLPAWLSAFAYKGKQYTYMINGETGEVGGKRPYSVPKIIAAVLVGLVLLFAVYNIFIKDADAAEMVYPEPYVTMETTTSTVSADLWRAPGWMETGNDQMVDDSLAA
ncbi:MAG: hypothetical protein RR614_13045, partial [Eubacterium sp.]